MSKKQPAGPGTTSTGGVKPKEDKEATFKRLASKRVSRAIKDLQLVGNLVTYKPTKEQVQIVESALAEAHKNTVLRLKGAAKLTAFSME